MSTGKKSQSCSVGALGDIPEEEGGTKGTATKRVLNPVVRDNTGIGGICTD